MYCLKPEVCSSREELGRLLADDFLEIPSTGAPYDKSHVSSRILDEVLPIFTQQDYQIRMLVEGLAQLIYKATIKGPNDLAVSYFVPCSTWKLSGQTWQMLFHQSTSCKPFDVFSNNVQ